MLYSRPVNILFNKRNNIEVHIYMERQGILCIKSQHDWLPTYTICYISIVLCMQKLLNLKYGVNGLGVWRFSFFFIIKVSMLHLETMQVPHGVILFRDKKKKIITLYSYLIKLDALSSMNRTFLINCIV